jgi:hypothetical protein
MSMRQVPIAVGHFAGAAGLWAVWMAMWLVSSRRVTTAADPTEMSPAFRRVVESL